MKTLFSTAFAVALLVSAPAFSNDFFAGGFAGVGLGNTSSFSNTGTNSFSSVDGSGEAVQQSFATSNQRDGASIRFNAGFGDQSQQNFGSATGFENTSDETTETTANFSQFSSGNQQGNNIQFSSLTETFSSGNTITGSQGTVDGNATGSTEAFADSFGFSEAVSGFGGFAASGFGESTVFSDSNTFGDNTFDDETGFGQNPGNGMQVGNSPFGGENGNSNFN